MSAELVEGILREARRSVARLLTAPLRPVRECPDCDRAGMIALSPMHPSMYLYLLCPAHRAEQLARDTDRKIELVKTELRAYVRRRFHDANEDLGLIPRCCHNPEWMDGIYPTRCGRRLDAQGRCPRCDR